MLSIDPGAGAVIGIQLDHDYVRVAIADLSLTLLAEGVTQSDVDHDAQAGLAVGRRARRLACSTRRGSKPAG